MMKALILACDEFEEAELLVPYYRLLEENIAVDIAAPSRGTVLGKHGYPCTATKSLAEIDPNDYAVLVIPGGGAADTLSEDEDAIRITEVFLEEHKLIAAICHGPLVLVATGLMEERHVTGHASIAFALRAAHAHYSEAPVVADDHVITARQPADLPPFMREVIKHVAMLAAGRSSAPE